MILYVFLNVVTDALDDLGPTVALGELLLVVVVFVDEEGISVDPNLGSLCSSIASFVDDIRVVLFRYLNFPSLNESHVLINDLIDSLIEDFVAKFKHFDEFELNEVIG